MAIVNTVNVVAYSGEQPDQAVWSKGRQPHCALLCIH